MKRKPNYLKHLLQWGVLAAIVGTVLWAKFSDKPVDRSEEHTSELQSP